MRAILVGFGVVEIDGIRYDHDVVIRGDQVTKRKKRASKPLRDRYGHTPLSLRESIPWGRPRLIVGTGVDGALPIDPEVWLEAHRRGVELVAVPTRDACALLTDTDLATTSAVLHVTC